VCLLEEELLRRCGERYRRLPDREATRFGSQPGVLVIGVRRCRSTSRVLVMWTVAARCCSNTYERLQRPEALPRSALAKDGARRCRAAITKGSSTWLATDRREEIERSRGFVKASADELEKAARSAALGSATGGVVLGRRDFAEKC